MRAVIRRRSVPAAPVSLPLALSPWIGGVPARSTALALVGSGGTLGLTLLLHEALGWGLFFVYLPTALLVSWGAESLRAARRSAEEHAGEAEELAEQLQDLALDLEQQIDQSRELVEMLAERNEELAFARQQAEELASEQEAACQRLTALLAGLADGFLVCDGDWSLSYVSPRTAELLRAVRRTDQLVGRTLWGVLPECAGGVVEERLRRAVLRQGAEEFEVRLPALGGRCRFRVHACTDGVYLCWNRLALAEEARERAGRWEAASWWDREQRGVAVSAGETLY